MTKVKNDYSISNLAKKANLSFCSLSLKEQIFRSSHGNALRAL
jgi:rRNA maturation endonuclease Nob1